MSAAYFPAARDETLVAAAKFERDRRGERYPRLILDGKITAEAAAIDYQCWVAIAEFVETGGFMGFYGGADPQGPNAPWIGWPELEDAARKALHRIERKLAAEAWLDGMPPTPTSERRNALARIHRTIQLQRERIEAINAGFCETREGVPA